MEARHLILTRILLLFTIITSCSKEIEVDYYKIYGIKNEKSEQIGKNGYIFFAKSEDEHIYLVESFEIYHAYKGDSKASNYEEFFNDILNQKKSMKIDSINHKCFKIDKKINNDFLKLEKDEFLKKYTVTSGYKNKYFINSKLEWEEIENVGYFLFESGFGIIFDDHLGGYYVNNLNKDNK
ncbi:hypothetical protein [Flavobacterium reichenbachii]|uniref:Lipoprotein n=1 Tax=Flavobacterium reichenbachii TaxID=362418 RepID=A0A085ZDV8_9FLAO|nr:hypothetical protein [Flavobacterium reichenbachii]KFF02622.1 hypothetical protein IW19_23435 [Flavobacterium reichenbachii]OXB11119.1 hypothetical protein B0A68_21070 [Flavobacterium reichenbachii]